MSLHDYAKKHKMKDYDKSFKMIRNIKEEPGLLNQSKKEPPTDEISRTYRCEICNFETKYNFNLVAHYKTLKHITNAKSKGEITENVEPSQNKDASNEIIVEAVETNGNGPDSRKRQAPSRFREESAPSRSNSPLEIKITGNSTPTHEILKRPKIEQKVDPTPKESSRPWHSGCEYCCQICGKMHYALNELLFHVRNKHNMTGKECSIFFIDMEHNGVKLSKYFLTKYHMKRQMQRIKNRLVPVPYWEV